MQALAACGLEKASEVELQQKVADLPCRETQDLEAERLVRVEIENQAIGRFEGVDGDAPIVDFKRSDLSQRDEAARIFDVEIGAVRTSARKLDLFYGG